MQDTQRKNAFMSMLLLIDWQHHQLKRTKRGILEKN